MIPLVKALGQFALSYALTEVATKNVRAKVIARKLLIAAGLFLAGFMLGTVGVIFTILGIFFAASNTDNLIVPAFISAIISLLISAFVIVQGLRQLRR